MSTVFTQAYNLSDNVKYMNFKVDTTPSGGGNPVGSTTVDDRKELMHRIQEFIATDRDDTASGAISKTLGWQRIDGADSAGAILTNSDNVDTGGAAAYGFLRAKCYDYSTSGHWKYLRLKLFERHEQDLFPVNNTSRGPRYLTSDNVMVLRYDIYSDWPGITAEDSAAVVDSINGGSNSAEADGYGSTNLNASKVRGKLYGTTSAPLGFDAAYNSTALYVNQHNTIANNNLNRKKIIFGNGGTTAYPNRAVIDGEGVTAGNTAIGTTQSNNVGFYPYGTTNTGPKRGYGYGHNFYPFYYGVNGMGDSDLSVKNSYGELKLIIDGNGTLWGFGDQTNVGAGGTDSNSGTSTHKGVNATGANARYLAFFVTQHQDDNPEKTSQYNTILFAGEYKKEFGEPAQAAGYLHNGIKFNAHNFLMNNGVATPPNMREGINITIGGGGNATGTFNNNSGTSFYRNFTGADNNVNNRLAQSEYSGNVNSVTVSGDNTNTLPASNTVSARTSGHPFMGGVGIANTASQTTNRSLSMGATSDDRAYRGVWYDDTSWRSRTRGNNTAANATNNTYGSGTYTGSSGWYTSQRWLGFDGAQFALTEYPTRNSTNPVSGTTGNTREMVQTYDDYIAPSSGRQFLSATRLHMGYLGYVGHVNTHTAYSLNELFFGSRHGLFGDNGEEIQGSLSAYEPGFTAYQGRLATSGASIPLEADYLDSSTGNAQNSTAITREYVGEFHPQPREQTQYSVYEPVLSVGLLRIHQHAVTQNYEWNFSGNRFNGGYTNSYNNNQNNNTNHAFNVNFAVASGGLASGAAKGRSAFAMLGRTYGLKIFGPYEHDKYNFLDAVSIQLDDDGFYAVNPNNPVDHWVVPANTDQVSFLFQK